MPSSGRSTCHTHPPVEPSTEEAVSPRRFPKHAASLSRVTPTTCYSRAIVARPSFVLRCRHRARPRSRHRSAQHHRSIPPATFFFVAPVAIFHCISLRVEPPCHVLGQPPAPPLPSMPPLLSSSTPHSSSPPLSSKPVSASTAHRAGRCHASRHLGGMHDPREPARPHQQLGHALDRAQIRTVCHRSGTVIAK
jgi:hypothetical protein